MNLKFARRAAEDDNAKVSVHVVTLSSTGDRGTVIIRASRYRVISKSKLL